MKSTIFILSLAGLISSQAFGDERALITKNSYSGYTRPDYTFHEECKVYGDRVLITRDLGGAGTSEEKKVSTVGLKAIIARAYLEKISRTDNMICDLPSSVVKAAHANDRGEVEEFELYSTGGCGKARISREGGASHSLRSIIDAYCPKTY
jgi:hypothetical protein